MDATRLAAALDSAGRALPELSLKAALVLGAAGVLAFALRRSSAAARHLVWAAAIAGVLALPLAQLLPVRLEVLPAALRGAPEPLQAPAGEPLPEADTAPALRSGSGEPGAPFLPGPTPDTQAPETGTGTLLVGVWLLGAAVLVLRLLLGRVLLWRLARGGERIVDEAWTAAADRISRGFDAPSARLVRSARTEMPMTWGVLRPVVLLPASCGEWPEERREVVLRHELAHVARRDVLTLFLAQLACAVHWFNPLCWVALHQLRAEAERCCDDRVLSTGTRASTYAGHLLEMVRTIGRARVPSALVLPMAHRSTFEGRLLAILEPGVERGAPGRARTALTLGGIAVLVAALGALRPAGAAAAGAAGVPAPPPPAPPAAAAPPAPAAPPVAALVDAVAEADAPGRQSAARALGYLEDPRAVQALIEALRTDADPEVRTTAAWALGQIGSRAAVPALLQALASDRAEGVRRTAAWALGEIGDPQAAPGLVETLRDGDAEIRQTAVWALGQTRAGAGAAPLAELLRSGTDAHLRESAAWALGQIGGAASLPALTEALRDRSPGVRAQAAWAIGRIGDVPQVTRMLSHPDAEVRATAAGALAERGAGPPRPEPRPHP